MKNNDVAERHVTQRRGRVTIPCYFLVVDRMINYQRIWLKVLQLLVQHLLFYIPYKICTHSLISIDFMISVCQLFDKPPYKQRFTRHTGL